MNGMANRKLLLLHLPKFPWGVSKVGLVSHPASCSPAGGNHPACTCYAIHAQMQTIHTLINTIFAPSRCRVLAPLLIRIQNTECCNHQTRFHISPAQPTTTWVNSIPLVPAILIQILESMMANPLRNHCCKMDVPGSR